jgi:hypothetical protein
MDSDGGPYVVTDPDVVPARVCPLGWPAHLAGILARAERDCLKVGLGLRTDQVPASRLEGVLKWEAAYWADEWEPGVFRANTDTTCAVYRPWRDYPWFGIGPALRTGNPYLAEHLAWYEEDTTMPASGNGLPWRLSPELRFYYSRADMRYREVRYVKGADGFHHPAPHPAPQ